MVSTELKLPAVSKLLQLMLLQTQALFLQRGPSEVVALVVALELGQRPAMAS